MARPAGVEPTTFWSVVKRSIQLIYERIYAVAVWTGLEPAISSVTDWHVNQLHHQTLNCNNNYIINLLKCNNFFIFLQIFFFPTNYSTKLCFFNIHKSHKAMATAASHTTIALSIIALSCLPLICNSEISSVAKLYVDWGL